MTEDFESITLRRASEADLDFLWQLQEATLRPYVELTWGWDEAWQREHFLRFHDPAVLRIVQAGGRQIGSISIERFADRVHVGHFEILPVYQNRGIGTRLLRDVVAEADEAGVPVTLEVLKVNPARWLYKRLGFEVTRETETELPDAAAGSCHMIRTYADLAAEIREQPARLGAVRLVAVDGPGGAGKSTFAARLARALDDAPIIQTDDFAAWDDQFDWWPDLELAVLTPLANGESARYPMHDWSPRRVRGWRDVEPQAIVILEGVSSSRLEVADRLSFAILVDAPPDVRLARGINRDGDDARAMWERWMANEDAHFVSDGTRERADLVVDGAPTIAHDPASEFVQLRATR